MANTEDDLLALYGETVAPQKKIGNGRRLLTQLIDFVLVAGVFLLAFIFGGEPLIAHISKPNIDAINLVYQEMCDERGYVAVPNNEFGFYQVEVNSFMDNYIAAHPTVSEEEAYDKYIEARGEVDLAITKTDVYKENHRVFYWNYIWNLALFLLVPILVFELLVPVFDKKYHRTIGMYITKTVMVNKKNNQTAFPQKLILRFFVTYIIEYFIFLLLMQLMGLLISFLLMAMFILATKRKYAPHDFFSFTKIIEKRYFGLIEEEEPEILPPPPLERKSFKKRKKE